MSDPEQRPQFREQGGVERCIRVLESCLDEQDWSLACLVCQALWNYCIDSNNITESIVDEECLCNLEDILVYLLESCNETIQQRSPYIHSLSAEVLQSLECEEKEFCKVGLGLLKRILDDSPRQIELLLGDEESSSSSPIHQNSRDDKNETETRNESI